VPSLTYLIFLKTSAATLWATGLFLGANNKIPPAFIGYNSQGNGDFSKRLKAIVQSATAVIAR
jgi:hypothetical protein